MIETLSAAIPYLIESIAFLVIFVFAREGLRAIQRHRWLKRRAHSYELIRQFQDAQLSDTPELIAALRKSLPDEIIEELLDEYRENGEAKSNPKRLIEIYHHLGFVEKHQKKLTSGKSWPERANAAEKLGVIGHPQSIMPLVQVLQDENEDQEVKNCAVRALGKIRDERAVITLIDALALPNPVLTPPLLDAIQNFGSSAVPPLMSALTHSPHEHQKLLSARLLGLIGSHDCAENLIACLSHPSAKLRAEAALSLGRLKIKEAVFPLTKMILEDPVPLTREAAAEALGLIADDRALLALQAGLADLDPSARRQAMESLERMGELAKPLFLDALDTGSEEAQVRSAFALERLGVVSEWIETLATEKWEDKIEKLIRVAKAGVVETLASQLTHNNVKVRIRLCRILAECSNPRTLEALIDRAQKDDEWLVRLEAMLALIRLGDKRAIEIITKALYQEDEALRERLLNFLPQAEKSFLQTLTPAVSSLLTDSNLQIRVEAIRTLGQLNSNEVCAQLLVALQDSTPEVRQEAAHALCNFHQPHVLQALIASLQDPKREVRLAAVDSLNEHHNPSSLIPLAECFEWANHSERDKIAEALAAIPHDEFFALADILMGLSNPKTQSGIAWTLGLIGNPNGETLLKLFLKSDDHQVRSAAAGGLGKLAAHSNLKAKDRHRIANFLQPYLNDPNERVRAAVVNALMRCNDPASAKILLPLLNSEPDLFVQHKILLAIGSIANDFSDSPIKSNDIADTIISFLEHSSDLDCQTAGLITLILLNEKIFFEKTLRELFQSGERKNLFRKIIKELHTDKQEFFFKSLALDPKLVFNLGDKQETIRHYQQILTAGQSPRDRIAALRALLELDPKNTTTQIKVSFNTDPDPEVRTEALISLGKIDLHWDWNKMLEHAVRDPSEKVRAQILIFLQKRHPQELQQAREKIFPLLETENTKMRLQVAQLLARLYQEDWQALADRLLGNDNDRFRTLGLIETLRIIGDHKSAPLFAKLLNHSDPEIRAASAMAAAKAGLFSKSEWTTCLSDPKESIRLAALQGLGDHLDGDVLTIFSQHLEDPSVALRKKMAQILGHRKFLDDARPAFILHQLAQDENRDVQLASFVALYRLGTKDLVENFSKLWNLFSEDEKITTRESLTKDGFFMAITENLNYSRESSIRRDAIKLLAIFDLPSFANDIISALQDPASDVRLAAVQALNQSDNTAHHQALQALAEDPIESIRSAVKRRKLKTVK